MHIKHLESVCFIRIKVKDEKFLNMFILLSTKFICKTVEVKKSFVGPER